MLCDLCRRTGCHGIHPSNLSSQLFLSDLGSFGCRESRREEEAGLREVDGVELGGQERDRQLKTTLLHYCIWIKHSQLVCSFQYIRCMLLVKSVLFN